MHTTKRKWTETQQHRKQLYNCNSTRNRKITYTFTLATSHAFLWCRTKSKWHLLKAENLCIHFITQENKQAAMQSRDASMNVSSWQCHEITLHLFIVDDATWGTRSPDIDHNGQAAKDLVARYVLYVKSAGRFAQVFPSTSSLLSKPSNNSATRSAWQVMVWTTPLP